MHEPRQSEQPSQSPGHVHFFSHACLLPAHHCLHPVTITKKMLSLAAVPNHYGLHLPAAFDLVLGEAVTTVFVVDTIPVHQDGEVGVET